MDPISDRPETAIYELAVTQGHLTLVTPNDLGAVLSGFP
jgi:hypothetical protein